jgi:hypothetical protein
MTSGEPPAPPSLARFGGLALIGIGVLAAGFGVVAVLTGGPHNASDTMHSSGAPTPPASTRPPSAPAAVPSAATGVPPGSMPAPSSAGIPGVGSSPQGSGGIGEQAPQIVVRVYNNSMIQGLASRAADDFRRAGYDVAEVGNYASGIIPTTTIYYEPGTPERAQAEQIAATFAASAQPRFPGLENASPGLIAIITDDYKGPQRGK